MTAVAEVTDVLEMIVPEEWQVVVEWKR